MYFEHLFQISVFLYCSDIVFYSKLKNVFKKNQGMYFYLYSIPFCSVEIIRAFINCRIIMTLNQWRENPLFEK